MIGLLAWALALGAQAYPGPLERCDLPPGWAEVAGRGTRYIVFGEIHGTNEAPAFVGDVACGLAFNGERLLIAVEQNDNPALQAAWAQPDDRFAAALASAGWAGRNDGVASRAMFALLLRLHRLRAGGRQIDVVAFDGVRDAEQATRFAALPGQGPHEATQADTIRVADHDRYDHVLVLTGNLHARKEPVTRGGVSFDPMARRLGPPAAVTSLDMADAGGTMWNCLARPGAAIEAGRPIPADAIDCGDHPTHGSADLRRPAFIGLGAAPGREVDSAYDGFFWLGPVNGSPPQVPATPGRVR